MPRTKKKSLESLRRRKQLRLIKLFGTIDFDPRYDYKKARRRRRSL
jgi:hypothetical protein